MPQMMDGRGEFSRPYNHFEIDFELWEALIGGTSSVRPQFENYENVPGATHDIIQRCWEETPADRPTIALVVAELRQIQGRANHRTS